MKLVYPAVFTPFEDLTGYTVEVPDLPGCVTEGRCLSEAIEMGIDAASGWILGEMLEGNVYPSASDYHSIECPNGSFVTLLNLDMDVYSERYGSKTIRKSISIPAWLNTYAEKNNINCSRMLQDALIAFAQKDSALD